MLKNTMIWALCLGVALSCTKKAEVENRGDTLRITTSKEAVFELDWTKGRTHPAFFLLSSSIGTAKTIQSKKLIGLIEIPKLFGTSDPQGPPGQVPPTKKVSILLYKQPKKEKNALFEINDPSDLITREHGYEEQSAIVLQQHKQWTLIQSKKGNGWLSPEEAGAFRPYPSLAKDSAYLTGDWDLKLYKTPKNPKDFETISSDSPANGTSPLWQVSKKEIKVLARKTINEQIWFQIQMIHGRCSNQETLGKKGWVPGYNKSGQTNLWFHSRGC